MYKRVEVLEPPVFRQRSPFVAVCVGTSLVTQIEIPDENIVIGAPAATAPAVAGTAVPLFAVTAPVTERLVPVATPSDGVTRTGDVNVATPVTATVDENVAALAVLKPFCITAGF